MAQPVNPYAPPTAQPTTGMVAPGQPQAGAGYFREGDQLVVQRTGVVLPDRCIKCNNHAEHRLEKTFQWHPRWVTFIVIVSPLIYIIVAMVTRKTAKVSFALCDEHAQKRKNGILIGLGGGALSVLLIVLGIANDMGALALVGLVAMLGAIIAAAVMAKTMQPMKMDDTHAWLKVEPPFLNGVQSFGYGQSMQAPPAGFGG